MKSWSILGVVFIFASVAVAQENPEQQAEEYRQAGIKDAAIMREDFEKMEKPAYQNAYDDYLLDLELIASYGIAQDNEGLYDDLRIMNSDEEFIYSQSGRDSRFDYRRYNY